MKRLIIVCMCSFALSLSSFAQAPTAIAEQPKPEPEIQKLAYYLGAWKGEGETKGGPFGPAGKLSSTITCDWFAGGFDLVCRGEENGPTGKRTFLKHPHLRREGEGLHRVWHQQPWRERIQHRWFHRRKQK